MADTGLVRALVWDENPRHAPKEMYPDSLRGAVADGLRKFGRGKIEVAVAHLDQPEQGITEAGLAGTDVLLWWGHARHGDVNDTTVARVKERVHSGGMGFIALHSGHYSKTFQAVTGGHGHLKGGWRELNPMEPEQIRVCAPWHPIVEGIEDFILDHEEMYGAPFDVPPPEVLVLQSLFPYDGKTFPSGICWTVGQGIDLTFTSGPGGGKGQGEGAGRVFYFRPGHETVPTYFNETVQKILTNAVLWCAHAR